MKRLSVILLITVLLVSLSSQATLAQEDNSVDTREYIIIYDEGHAQYFTTELMQTALSSLNNSLDTDTLDVMIKLVVHDDEFNSTNLQGGDLVIVTNPGKDNGTLVEINGNQESQALENVVKNGGSVLLMSNPLSKNQNITGHGGPMNELIWSDLGGRVEVPTTIDSDNTTVIVDPLNYKENDTFVYVDSSNFNKDVFVLEPNDINGTLNQILTYSANIQTTNLLPEDFYANTSQFGFTYNAEYEIRNYQQGPKWMFGKDFADDQGRALILGSTVMFSDYTFDGNERWVDQAQNLQLFQNIIAWLLELTPSDPIVPIVSENFWFFITTDLFFAVLVSGALFAIIFGNYVLKGRLSPTEVLNIRIADKKQKQSDSSNKSDDGKKSTQNQSKRERRKRT